VRIEYRNTVTGAAGAVDLPGGLSPVWVGHHPRCHVVLNSPRWRPATAASGWWMAGGIGRVNGQPQPEPAERLVGFRRADRVGQQAVVAAPRSGRLRRPGRGQIRCGAGRTEWGYVPGP
jgi:hypothetical protein